MVSLFIDEISFPNAIVAIEQQPGIGTAIAVFFSNHDIYESVISGSVPETRKRS